MSDKFANYDLYADPYMNRLRNEVAKVKAKKEGDRFVPADFSHFDSLHYCGHNYLADFFESEKVDFLPEFNRLHQEMNDLCGITNTRIIQGDATQLNLAELGLEEQCHIVYSLQSFYYIGNKPALFANCNKALKIGGKLYIEDHVVENNIPLIEKEEEIASKFQFISRLQRAEYIKLLEDAGFHVDEYVYRTTEWSRYLFDRSERFLRDKASIIEEYGEELWNTRYIAGIHISCRLYHQLGMTLEEAKTAYPLTCIEFGEEEFEKWVCEMPEKFGGAYIKATKIRSI